jgi:hypothetical protein
MPKEKRGIVYIVDAVADFPDRPRPPGEARYHGYWDIYTEPDDPDEIEDGPGWDDAEEAIKWSRERAPLVIVRVDNQQFSAGEEDPPGEYVMRWESQ